MRGRESGWGMVVIPSRGVFISQSTLGYSHLTGHRCPRQRTRFNSHLPSPLIAPGVPDTSLMSFRTVGGNRPTGATIVLTYDPPLLFVVTEVCWCSGPPWNVI